MNSLFIKIISVCDSHVLIVLGEYIFAELQAVIEVCVCFFVCRTQFLFPEVPFLLFRDIKKYFSFTLKHFLLTNFLASRSVRMKAERM